MKYAGFALAVTTLAACSVYDESRLRSWPEAGRAAGPSAAGAGASAAGMGGAAGFAGGSGAGAGAAGAAGTGTAGQTAGRSGAGAGGTGAGGAGTGAAGSSGTGSPSPTQCGNGRVDAGEHCDTAIAAGATGACPTSCTAPNACTSATLQGSGCGTQCAVVERACVRGDGCCPAACNASVDDDCPGFCGDGVVQLDRGETCEASNEAELCPSLTDCADPDPCTLDGVDGSAAACNVTCTHTPITAANGGDGCCPPGANAGSDSDCQAQCGNGIREGSEACDGSTGCGPNCTQTLTASQIMCIDTIADTSCETCECTRCTDAMLACQSSGNAARDQACTSVALCALEQNCAGVQCYCGTANLNFGCAFAANGACKRVIETAAGTTSATRIQAMTADPNSVLGRALSLGDCRRARCAVECP